MKKLKDKHLMQC